MFGMAAIPVSRRCFCRLTWASTGRTRLCRRVSCFVRACAHARTGAHTCAIARVLTRLGCAR